MKGLNERDEALSQIRRIEQVDEVNVALASSKTCVEMPRS